jgi:hypothetical protein
VIEPIRIDGLREFARNLRQLDKDLPKGIRLAGNEAAKLIIGDAKHRIPVGPATGGHATSSLKAKSTRTEVRVSAGGNRYPYYPWLDFGGKVGRNRSVSRPFLKTGRYIWHAFKDNKNEVEQAYLDGLMQVAKSAGIEVT